MNGMQQNLRLESNATTDEKKYTHENHQFQYQRTHTQTNTFIEYGHGNTGIATTAAAIIVQ